MTLRSSGMKVLAGYLVLTYLIPAGISPLIRDELTVVYHDVFGLPWPLLLVLVFPVLVGVLYLLVPRIRVPRAVGVLNPFRYSVLNGILVVVFLATAILFQQNYGLGFRHTGPGMLGAAFYVPVVFGLKVYFKVFALYVYLRALRAGRIMGRDRFILVGAVGASALSVMAAMDIPLLMLMLALSVAPVTWIVGTSCSIGSDSSLKGSFIRVASYALLAVAGAGAVFVGVANKIGSEETLRLTSSRESLVGQVTGTVGTRMSMHYATLMTYANHHLFDTDLKLEALTAPVSDLKSRVCRLSGTRCEPEPGVWEPDVWSVNRMTRVLVYRVPLEKSGASPGLLGAALLLPFFPAGVLAVGLLATVALRLLDGAVPKNATFTILGILILVYFVMPIFNNLLDLLLRPIDPSFLYAGLMLVMLLDLTSGQHADRRLAGDEVSV